MKTKTRVKAGAINHNEALVRGSTKKGLTVKTRVKAGELSINHNETLVVDRLRKS